MDITVTELSHGVGGSYTQWQRKPPAHKIYQIELPDNTITTITVFAENNELDPEDHPTIQKIIPTNQFKSDVNWNQLETDTQNTIRNTIKERVAKDDWFQN